MPDSQPVKPADPRDAGPFLSAGELAAIRPKPVGRGRDSALEAARQAMRDTGCWRPGQQMGQRWPVACVALEITQRCNLDCTLCYLSEHSEAVQDLPLPEVFRRIDAIAEHYGSGVDVQVTGGDPTLRKREELVAIIERLSQQGQRPTLMTNGIKATPALLRELARAGLSDVVFHVDTTQERKGPDGRFYPVEAALNPIRERYIEAAEAAGLNAMFNTTVHRGNVADIDELARFFAARAGRVRTASFQLQADTGRGISRGRPDEISIDSVWSRIESGAGTTLNNGASLVGHPQCSRYGLGLLANGRIHDLFDRPALVQEVQALTADLPLSRLDGLKAGLPALARLVRRPGTALRALGWLAEKAARIALGRPRAADALTASRPLGTISFVIHNFMHAGALERDRIDACVFMVMTRDGPVSMCVHNAKRDEFILAPIKLGETADGEVWNPLGPSRTAGFAGSAQVLVAPPDPAVHGLKHSKGRTRARLMAARAKTPRRRRSDEKRAREPAEV